MVRWILVGGIFGNRVRVLISDYSLIDVLEVLIPV